MPDTLDRLAGPVAPGTGPQTILTVPGGHTYTIRYIAIVNNNAITVDVKLGINGVADADLILPFTPILIFGQGVFSGVLTLEAGDTLMIDSDATGITVTVSGLDQD
jgi:hypothetical protein